MKGKRVAVYEDTEMGDEYNILPVEPKTQVNAEEKHESASKGVPNGILDCKPHDLISGRSSSIAIQEDDTSDSGLDEEGDSGNGLAEAIRLKGTGKKLRLNNTIFDCQVTGKSLAEEWAAYASNNPTEGTPMKDAYSNISWEARDPKSPINRDYRPAMARLYNYILENGFPVPDLNAKRLSYFKPKRDEGPTWYRQGYVSKEESEVLFKKFPNFRSGYFSAEEYQVLIHNLKRFFVRDMGYTSPHQCISLMEEIFAVRGTHKQHHIRLYFASFIAGPKMLEYRLAVDIFKQIKGICTDDRPSANHLTGILTEKKKNTEFS